eukprot:CAMPEP_0172654374 /NCGR_PEP_ID=MMETSP1068-20121228/244301_1 /TAXON_ID=35684 /ORGANISM="Pseudopedinella elastica, Strain CCMP716" /LENGTH=101 /DNA_ID=CAMNT_0013468819 /DNA_START=627 /DNA_END=929 /DNA_ORIENTATION=-
MTERAVVAVAAREDHPVGRQEKAVVPSRRHGNDGLAPECLNDFWGVEARKVPAEAELPAGGEAAVVAPARVDEPLVGEKERVTEPRRDGLDPRPAQRLDRA